MHKQDEKTNGVLPEGTAARKEIPMATGVLDYFPAALAYIAKISKAGNDKHNPGQPLHWARGKSMDHADCIMRHLVDRGTIDGEDNLRHSGKLAWRALALLEEELEREEGAPLPRGAWVEDDAKSPAPLAWNEGWKCKACGGTHIMREYGEGEVQFLAQQGLTPMCDNCRFSADRMVRDK